MIKDFFLEKKHLGLQFRQLIIEPIKTLWFFPYQPYVCFCKISIVVLQT